MTETPQAPSPTGASFGIDLELPPERALALLEETVLAWGGETQWQGARDDPRRGGQILRLTLPVRAGLRRGWVAGAATASPLADGPVDVDASRLRFDVDHEEYRVDKAAFGVLLLAAFGALLTIVAPLVPRLLPLVPMGIFLAVAAWLFIVARLRNSGPEELFESLERALGVGVEDAEEDSGENAGPATR